MLKRWLLALGLLAGAAGLAEAATVAVATGNVNLRAGPSTAYPVVTVVPAGARIVPTAELAPAAPAAVIAPAAAKPVATAAPTEG